MSMPNTGRLPFILQFAEEIKPSPMSGHYDHDRQVWVFPTPESGAAVPPTTIRTSEPREYGDEIAQGPGE